VVLRKVAAVILAFVIASLGLVAQASSFGPWTTAVEIEQFGPGAHPDFNTSTALEGCPFTSRDGRAFFIASDRAGGLGGLDIWVSTRARTTDPWGAPVNLGAPINSAHNDFCPTLAQDGREFFFVSNRPGHCGATANGDIYTTRFRREWKAEPVTHLGCVLNSEWDEHSPFPSEEPELGEVLYMSSARPSGPADTPGDHDLYLSEKEGGSYGAATPLNINTNEYHEGQPNVRRDGLEIFFYSNRPGTLGGNDIYLSTRVPGGLWGEPVNLGPSVNSAASETRPSLSWDATTLYFGSTRAGTSDVYVTTR
jgi:hypothetical protein